MFFVPFIPHLPTELVSLALLAHLEVCHSLSCLFLPAAKLLWCDENGLSDYIYNIGHLLR